MGTEFFGYSALGLDSIKLRKPRTGVFGEEWARSAKSWRRPWLCRSCIGS